MGYLLADFDAGVQAAQADGADLNFGNERGTLMPVARIPKDRRSITQGGLRGGQHREFQRARRTVEPRVGDDGVRPSGKASAVARVAARQKKTGT
jgi:hypothetical protein